MSVRGKNPRLPTKWLLLLWPNQPVITLYKLPPPRYGVSFLNTFYGYYTGFNRSYVVLLRVFQVIEKQCKILGKAQKNDFTY